MFQITIQSDGTLKASVLPKDEDYFSDFNTIKWLKEAEEYAVDNDCFEDPISNEECWLVPDGDPIMTSPKIPTPIKVGKVNILDIINKKKEEENIEATEEKPKVIGEFKPKRQFINFISAVSAARVRFISNIAFVKGKELSGVLEDLIFKITICDEGTINFEEVETTKCDKSMIQRLIDDIDSTDVTGYAQKFVVAGIEFADVDGGRCYLEVEHKKPIDILRSFLDNIDEAKEEVKEEVKELSAKGMSFLDQLFGSDDAELSEKDAEILVDGIENPAEPNESLKEAAAKWPKESILSDKQYVDQIMDLAKEKGYIEEKPLSHMEQEFNRLNAEKIEELKNRVEKKEAEIKKYNINLKQTESNIETAKKDLGVLETRLESMYPGDDPNGYIFYISEEQKRTDMILDDKTKEIASEIGKLVGIKEEVLFDFLTGVFYTIKIARKDDIQNETLVIDKDILDKIKTIDVTGKLAQIGVNEFEYRGKLNWHQLVGKMIRKGFEQNPEFNKLCFSNSYESKEENKKDVCGCGCSTKEKKTCDGECTDCGCDDNCKCNENKTTNMEIRRYDDYDDEPGFVPDEEYLFAIVDATNAYIEPDYGKFYLAINPKSYWDSDGCQYDQHITVDNGGELDLPEEIEEVAEGQFMYLGLDVKDCIAELVRNNIKFNQDFQIFMEGQNFAPFTVNGLSLNNYMLQTYPNSVI
jgi:hypothetical protein